MGRRRICEERPSARRSACDPLNRVTSDAMFKIIAVVVIGILLGIGFFDFGHFQKGRSRSCIELHPILAIERIAGDRGLKGRS